MTLRTPPPTAATPTPSSAVQTLPRRHFGLLLSSAGLALLAACSKRGEPDLPATPAAADPAPAPASGAASVGAAGTDLPMLDPADPMAKARAYVADASTLDAARNPPYLAGQACGNCALFAGQPGQAAAPCPLYAGNRVSAQGWCSAYVKKPA
jgi:High potential iron-sulfur protein